MELGVLDNLQNGPVLTGSTLGTCKLLENNEMGIILTSKCLS
jgi:hypothetical protein